MFYYIKFRKIKIKHIISRLSFNIFHLDYTHFKTSIHTGFLSWKNMRQNDDVMMRITQNCTRTTQITMLLYMRILNETDKQVTLYMYL